MTETKTPVQRQAFLFIGAADEARTRYLHLGKVALYQMSYSRRLSRRTYQRDIYYSKGVMNCQA